MSSEVQTGCFDGGCYWRWTERFHRDGKQHLGMGDCQLRKGQGQTRHLYMILLARIS